MGQPRPNGQNRWCYRKVRLQKCSPGIASTARSAMFATKGTPHRASADRVGLVQLSAIGCQELQEEVSGDESGRYPSPVASDEGPRSPNHSVRPRTRFPILQVICNLRHSLVIAPPVSTLYLRIGGTNI